MLVRWTRTHLNAARMSAAGEDWTEPNNYLRKAQMQIESYIVLHRRGELYSPTL